MGHEALGGFDEVGDEVVAAFELDIDLGEGVFEAVSESLNIKRGVYSLLEENVEPTSLILTVTSSLSIQELSLNKDFSKRYAGFHPFSPISKMKLFELVFTQDNDDETKDSIIQLAKDLDKTQVKVRDIRGFIVNRLLFRFIHEAIIIFEKQVASKENIDTAVELGLNHPMGPLKLADYIGLDTCKDILENFMDEYGSGELQIP